MTTGAMLSLLLPYRSCCLVACVRTSIHEASLPTAASASSSALLSPLPAVWPWNLVSVGPLKLSPLGLGTWAWGNKFLWGYEDSMDEGLQEAFNFAVQKGINLFDTADSYGTGDLNGRSELLLGKFVQQFPGSQRRQRQIVIASKFAAYPWRITAGQFVEACKASLMRLKMDQLGIGQLHWSTANYAPLQERALWDGLVAMHREGLVKAVGVSNYGPKQLLRIYAYLEKKGVPLVSVQVQFSLLSMGPDQMEIKRVCKDLGMTLIAYSPLGLGMLTGKYSNSILPKGPRSILFRRIIPGLRPLLQSLELTASRRGKTVSQVALNWCLCKGVIPIPGVKNINQVRENIGALGWCLSGTEIAQLEYAAAQSPTSMIQNVFQTK